MTLSSSCDVPLSEGPVNLSWPAIMKTVNEDPFQFYGDGGWTFLTGGGDVRYGRSKWQSVQIS
jgi:nucleosome binding factor SPN SPT16 subunit